MKKLLVASVFALTSFGFTQGAMGFEPEYDETTHYISNIVDWTEYEQECAAKGIDPVYEDYEWKYGGQCDLEKMEQEGIDPEEELNRLFAGANK